MFASSTDAEGRLPHEPVRPTSFSSCEGTFGGRSSDISVPDVFGSTELSSNKPPFRTDFSLRMSTSLSGLMQSSVSSSVSVPHCCLLVGLCSLEGLRSALSGKAGAVADATCCSWPDVSSTVGPATVLASSDKAAIGWVPLASPLHEVPPLCIMTLPGAFDLAEWCAEGEALPSCEAALPPPSCAWPDMHSMTCRTSTRFRLRSCLVVVASNPSR